METLFKVGMIVGGLALVGCQTGHQTEVVSETYSPEPLVDAQPAQDVPEPTFAQAPAATPGPTYAAAGFSAAGRQYTVQRGDTLWSIATRSYNDPHKWRDIQAANPGLQPSKLRVGQQIFLP